MKVEGELANKKYSNANLFSVFSQICEHGESTSHSSTSLHVKESSFNSIPLGHEQLKLYYMKEKR